MLAYEGLVLLRALSNVSPLNKITSSQHHWPTSGQQNCPQNANDVERMICVWALLGPYSNYLPLIFITNTLHFCY